MPEKSDIFDDPRTKLRIAKTMQEESAQSNEEVPAAEEDWYLKRKPLVSHVGIVKEAGNKKDGNG